MIRIGDEVRADRMQSRPKVFNEPQEWIAHKLFIPPLVLLKPVAVVVLLQFAKELEQFW